MTTSDPKDRAAFRLPGDPTRWLAAGALLVALIALAVALGSGGGDDESPAADPAAAGTPTPGGESPDSSSASPPPPGTASPSTGPIDTTSPDPAPSSTGRATATEPVACPEATVRVSDAIALQAALDDAAPGDSIALADGSYVGEFVAAAPGTADAPVFLCGGPGAVLDGGDVEGGYGLHLDGASHWRLVGFTVRNAKKGVMADGVQGAVIQGLTVEQIGDEAVHLRGHSSGNLVEANTIRNTGLRREKYGEGVYIGSATSNWCDITECEPDRSDDNIIRGNHISETTAESIDIKEGTTGGLVIGNTFDGARLSGGHNDSWVDVKGNDWTIQDNTGRNSFEDGFQTHQIIDDWGTGNVFTGNVAHVDGAGYGFHFAPVKDNTLTCDNEVTGADKGLANTDCTP